MKTTVISGSIAYDYIMDYQGVFTDHLLQDHVHALSVSFMINRLQKLRGGTGQNIAYTMGLLRGEHMLLGAVGKDFEYTSHIESTINLKHILHCEDVYTASAYVITDSKNNQITPFYPGAMERAHEQMLTDLLQDKERPERMIVSPNNTAAMMRHIRECKELGIEVRFDPGQVTTFLTQEDLTEAIEFAHTLIVNTYEFELIQHRTGYTAEKLYATLPQIIVTSGEKGVDLYRARSEAKDEGKEHIHIDALHCDNVVDPTGAGDALRGGVLYGLQQGYEMSDALCIGTLCAWYCIQAYGGQGHIFTKEEFAQKFQDCYKKELQ